MMTRRLARGVRRLQIYAIFVFFLAGGAPAVAQTNALPERLPINTVVFVHWHGMRSVTSAEGTNHVVQLFEDPQFIKTRDAALKSLRDNIAKNGPATSEPETAEVLSLLDNPAVIGVVLNPNTPAKQADGTAAPPATGFFVVYDAQGKTAIVEKLRKANRAGGKEVPTVMSYDFRGTKIEAHTTGTDVSYTALTPKFYFLADQKPVIEELITRFTAEAKPPDSVLQLPEYESIRTYIGVDSSFDFFARFPNLTKAVNPVQLDKPAMKFAVNLHLERIKVFGGSVSFGGEATRFHGAMLGDAAAGSLFDFAGASSSSFVTEPAVSAGPVLAISKYNFAAIFQMLLTAAQPLLTPQQAASVEMYQKIAQSFLGMSIEDALQLFTGEFASRTSFTDQGADVKSYAVSIQKPQDVLRILRAAAGGFITGEDTAGDTTFLDLAIPTADPKTGVKKRELYYVAVTPNVLFAAPRKAVIKDAIAHLNAKSDASSAGILANPEVAKARAVLPEKLTGLSAADIKQIPWDKVVAHYAELVAQEAKDSTKDSAKDSKTPSPSMDWLQTVKPEVVTRHLHIGISGWWKDSNGIYFDSYLQ